MKIRLTFDDIANVNADGLVIQVDGSQCDLGGPAASKALKYSIDSEDRMEIFGYLENDVKKLRPLKRGGAKIIHGEGAWEYLVIIAAVPHHVNDVIITQSQFASILEKSIFNCVIESHKMRLKSIAMTTIGTGYRLSPELSISSIVKGLYTNRRLDIEVVWCFIDEKQFTLAKKCCEGFNLEYSFEKKKALK